MTITNTFREAVRSKNIKLIRVMMKNSMLQDTSMSEFNAMKKEADHLYDRLYDSYDGKTFEVNREKWNESYLDRLCVDLLRNFSKERILHLQMVVQKLYPSPISEYKYSASVVKNEESKSNRTNSRLFNDKRLSNWFK